MDLNSSQTFIPAILPLCSESARCAMVPFVRFRLLNLIKCYQRSHFYFSLISVEEIKLALNLYICTYPEFITTFENKFIYTNESLSKINWKFSKIVAIPKHGGSEG